MTHTHPRNSEQLIASSEVKCAVDKAQCGDDQPGEQFKQLANKQTRPEIK